MHCHIINFSMNSPEAPLKDPRQYAATEHNKTKLDLRNGEYRSVLERLLRLERPDPHCLPAYLEDLATACSKVLREQVRHREGGSGNSQQTAQLQGRDAVARLYRLLLVEEGVTAGRASVPPERAALLSRFLTLVLSLLLQLALLAALQARPALELFSAGHALCSSVLTSSTAHYKLLRKASQFLLCFASWLIQQGDVVQATAVLFQALANEGNLLLLAARRRGRGERARRRETYDRLFALFLDLAVCYQRAGQPQWGFLCLGECHRLAELKSALLGKDLKVNWQELLRPHRVLYQQHRELQAIVQTYFSLPDLDPLPRPAPPTPPEPTAKHQTQNTLSSAAKMVPEGKKGARKALRRSVSLQDKLDHQNNRRLFKDFGQEVLFYGFDLFHPPRPTPAHPASTALRLRSLASQTHPIDPPARSKLVKRGRQAAPRAQAVLEPAEYAVVLRRVEGLWAEEERADNSAKERICLLRYKSQQLSSAELARGQRNAHEEIPVSHPRPLRPPRRRTHDPEEQDHEHGLALLKKILLRHAPQLQLRKSETLGVLRRTPADRGGRSCSEAQTSVEFLLERARRGRKAARESGGEEDGEQRLDNVFLTRDTVEIPNLFLSYIAAPPLPK